MFCLEQNKRGAYYAAYLGNEERVSPGGIRSLTYEGKYGNPTPIRISLNPRSGNPQIDAFGIDTDYQFQAVTETPAILHEGDIMWIFVTPNDEGTVAADYVVVKVAETINEAIYALRERKKKQWNTASV